MAYTVYLWDKQVKDSNYTVRAVLKDTSANKDIYGPDLFAWDHKPTKAELNDKCREWVINYLKSIYPWQNYKDKETEALNKIQEIVGQFVAWNVPTSSTITTRGTQLYTAIKNSTDALQTAETAAATAYRDNFLTQTTIDLSWD